MWRHSWTLGKLAAMDTSIGATRFQEHGILILAYRRDLFPTRSWAGSILGSAMLHRGYSKTWIGALPKYIPWIANVYLDCQTCSLVEGDLALSSVSASAVLATWYVEESDWPPNNSLVPDHLAPCASTHQPLKTFRPFCVFRAIWFSHYRNSFQQLPQSCRLTLSRTLLHQLLLSQRAHARRRLRLRLRPARLLLLLQSPSLSIVLLLPVTRARPTALRHPPKART